MTGRLALPVLMLAAAAAVAEPLGLPLACRPGVDCWVMNYVDDDPGPGASDYRCGPRSYDGHDGTDFAIRDRAAMDRGVAVLASAAGVVAGMRDGQPDGAFAEGDRAAVKGIECGNGVLLRHADGTETQYCHLRRGSVAVHPGQAVARGERLGLVGLSGMSQFPHVHITVRVGGRAVDPFTGDAPAEGCGRPGAPLWADAPAYEPGALYAAGFADHVPDPAQLKRDADSPPHLPADRPLVLWGALFGAAAGDQVRLSIRGPGGSAVLDHAARLERTQAWAMCAAGRPAPPGGWPAGTYVGEATVERADGTRLARQATVMVP